MLELTPSSLTGSWGVSVSGVGQASACDLQLQYQTQHESHDITVLILEAAELKIVIESSVLPDNGSFQPTSDWWKIFEIFQCSEQINSYEAQERERKRDIMCTEEWRFACYIWS